MKPCMRMILCVLFSLPASAGVLSDIIDSTTDAIGVETGGTVDPSLVKGAVKLGTAAAKMADNHLGPVEEFYLGRTVAARLLGGYPKTLPSDHPAARYVSEVGLTVTRASRAPYLYRPYTFILLDTAEKNAFAAPGGIIFVTTGLLKSLDNEDELAGVLGHETAHIELRHGLKTIEQENQINFLGTAKEVAVDTAANTTGATHEEVQVFDQLTGPVVDGLMDDIRNGYSVEQEAEADARSLEICNGLGYDPKAFVNLLSRMESEQGGGSAVRYPADRGRLTAGVLKGLKGSDAAAVIPERTTRFQQAMETLPAN